MAAFDDVLPRYGAREVHPAPIRRRRAMIRRRRLMQIAKRVS